MVSFIKNEHNGLSPSVIGIDKKCPCFNFGEYHLTSLYMLIISISIKLGKNPVRGLKQKARKPLAFNEVIGITSGSPASLSHTITLQSRGILTILFPILSNAAGELNISKNTKG